MGDLASLFQEAVKAETEQQKSTDWKRLLASSIAQGLTTAGQEFEQYRPNDYGSRLGAALLQGIGTGYTNVRDKAITEDVNSKFLSGINDYETGKAESLAKALQGLGLEQAASQVGSFDTARALERKQSIVDGLADNKLKLAYYEAETPLYLERQNQIAKNALAQALAVQGLKNSAKGGVLLGAPSADLKLNRESILNDPNLSVLDKQIALTKILKSELPDITDNAALLSSQQLLREKNLGSTELGNYGLEIERKVPANLQKQAIKELGLLQKQQSTLKTIDKVFDSLKEVGTLASLVPKSEAAKKFDALKSSLETNVMSQWKGVMSKTDRDSVTGLFPSRFDTPENLEISKQQMKQAITNIAENASPTLSIYGIKHPSMISQQEQDAAIPQQDPIAMEKAELQAEIAREKALRGIP